MIPSGCRAAAARVYHPAAAQRQQEYIIRLPRSGSRMYVVGKYFDK